MRAKIFKNVQEIISEQMNYSPEKVTLNSELGYDLDIVSLDKVELFTNIEAAYHIQIEDEAADNVETVQDLVDLIEAKIS